MIEMKTFDSREEWLQARKSFIGGSDASSIVGMNPYKSNVELWLEKTGQYQPEDISDKPYVRYGHDAEEHLRALYALDHPEMQVFYEDNNMWLNDRYPFGHVSLDGWLMDEEGRQGVLEIKTTEILRSRQKEDWRDRIPENYYVQVLWEMEMFEAEFAVLVAQLKSTFEGILYKQVKEYKIERCDVQQDIDYLMQEAAKFSECIRTKRRPDLILPAI